MQDVERDLNSWRSFQTTKQIADEVIKVAGKVLPNVNIYVALLSAGGGSLEYIACSENSKMIGNVLRSNEGISFGVIEQQVVTNAHTFNGVLI